VIFLAAAAFVSRAAMGDTPTTAPATAFRLQGKVTDAQTGAPIAAFRLVPRYVWGNSRQTQWQRANSQNAYNGTYEFVPRQLPVGVVYLAYVLRVEADGYEPAISPAYVVDGKIHTYDFKLKAGKNVEGIVLTPDGQPAVNARVTLVLPDEQFSLQISRLDVNGTNLQTTSDAQGKFSFFPQAGNYAVVAFQDSGWAQVDQDALSRSSTVKLQPWGRVEGVAKIGRKLVAHGQIQLQWTNRDYDPTQPMVWAVDQTVTDEKGKFTFDRVPAGQLTISRISADGRGSASESATVQAGQTVAVQIGGNGRSIIGHVVKPDGAKSSWQCQGYLQGQPTPPPPSNELLAAGKAMKQTMADPEISPQQKDAWLSQWRGTPEGQAYQTALNAYQQSMFSDRRSMLSPVTLSIAPDGSFRADDVRPGTYQLIIYQIQVAEGGGSSQVYAMIQRQITVSGPSDDPLDLGQLKLALSNPPASVAEAPVISIEAKTLDGKTFKLADHRGAYVLLDLWATWTPLSDTRLAALNDVFAAFGQDKKFFMIGLGAGDSMQDVAQFAQQHAMSWTQASLDESAAQSIAELLGVNSLPAVVLIGPDGKVIAAGLRGPGIRNAVQAALNNP
jgi:peroxiredoxin